jgi:hypothetical protein
MQQEQPKLGASGVKKIVPKILGHADEEMKK